VRSTSNPPPPQQYMVCVCVPATSSDNSGYATSCELFWPSATSTSSQSAFVFPQNPIKSCVLRHYCNGTYFPCPRTDGRTLAPSMCQSCACSLSAQTAATCHYASANCDSIPGRRYANITHSTLHRSFVWGGVGGAGNLKLCAIHPPERNFH
jgi:hypothetical protein